MYLAFSFCRRFIPSCICDHFIVFLDCLISAMLLREVIPHQFDANNADLYKYVFFYVNHPVIPTLLMYPDNSKRVMMYRRLRSNGFLQAACHIRDKGMVNLTQDNWNHEDVSGNILYENEFNYGFLRCLNVILNKHINENYCARYSKVMWKYAPCA